MKTDQNKPIMESQARDSKVPRVSIGMPIYNGERLMQRALDSLLAQTFTDFELIICDNASTDATQRICLEYAAKDKRIRYYRNDAQIQPISNFNRVLGYASGEYFMWAAHDDRWAPAFIEELVQELNGNPEAALAFCRFVNIDEEGHTARVFKTDWADVFSRSKFWQLTFLICADDHIRQKATHIYGLMRRDALVAGGGMIVLTDIDYAGEDNLTLLRLLAKWNFVIVDQLLFYYRERLPSIRPTHEPLAGYVWQRIFHRKPNHQGNLFLFFRRTHVYYSNVRKLVINETSLPRFQKLLLWLVTTLKEVWFPVSFLPMAALRELRVLR
jgi:glycosyltransferase involved in cell wall biosynthesis